MDQLERLGGADRHACRLSPGAAFFAPVGCVDAQVAFGRFVLVRIPDCPVRPLRTGLNISFAAYALGLIDLPHIAVLAAGYLPPVWTFFASITAPGISEGSARRSQRIGVNIQKTQRRPQALGLKPSRPRSFILLRLPALCLRRGPGFFGGGILACNAAEGDSFGYVTATRIH